MSHLRIALWLFHLAPQDGIAYRAANWPKHLYCKGVFISNQDVRQISTWIPASPEMQASKEGGTSACRQRCPISSYSCIFEVAVPRKPLACLKMAVSSLFMRRGGHDCGTASSAALSNLATKTDPKLGPPGGPKNGAAVAYLTAKPSRTAAPKMGPAL